MPYPDYMQETVNAYGVIFGYVPRIVIASLLGFLCGELANAKFMELIKAKTGEKHLWMRTIGSSMIYIRHGIVRYRRFRRNRTGVGFVHHDCHSVCCKAFDRGSERYAFGLCRNI